MPNISIHAIFVDIKILKTLAKEHKDSCNNPSCCVSLTQIREIARKISVLAVPYMTNAERLEYTQLMDFNDWPH